MADSQITLLPSAPVQGPNQIAQGSTSQGNPALASQPPGTVLQGFIINRDASGNPIVRTDKGDIPFSSNFFLKIGSEVVIRIGNTGGNAVAHLLSVDGQSPEEAQGQSAFAQEPEVILGPNLSQSPATTSLSSAATTILAATQEPGTAITVSGTVIAQPTPAQGNTPAQASLPQEPAVPAGTQLTLKVVSINAPATGTPAPTGETVPQATSASYATYARAAGATPATPVSVPPAPLVNAPPTAPANAAPAVPASPNLAPATPVQVATVPAGNTTPILPGGIQSLPQPASTQLPLATPSTTTAVNVPATPSTEATPNSATPPPLPAANAPIATGNAPTIALSQSTVVLPSTAHGEQPVTIPAQAAAIPPAPSNPLLQPGANVTATVLGSDSSGTLVQSTLGLVRLQTGSVLPSGSEVSFEVIQALPPALQNVVAPPIFNSPPAPASELGQQWSSLQQIFSLLSGRTSFAESDETPAPAPHLLATQNPNNPQAAAPNAQTITSGLFSYIAALRSGDFASWLGAGNVRTLQQDGHDDLLKKVQDEFSTLARQFTQTPPNHWQALFFPLPVDGTTQQVRIFVKRDRKQGSQKKNTDKEEDTRFVIEVGLSQLGELQMDGFVRRQENTMQFDMIIRSMAGLSSEIQNDILRIYNDMGAITGYSGTVTFQSVKAFPVNPLQEIAATHNAVLA